MFPVYGRLIKASPNMHRIPFLYCGVCNMMFPDEREKRIVKGGRFAGC